MRKLALLLVAVVGLVGLGGCATPAYDGGENVSRVLRTWDYEWKQAVDDAGYELMLYPPSRSTIWNLR